MKADKYAYNPSAICDRLHLIAYERGLADDEVEAALNDDDAFWNFGYRHGLSFDWVLFGDLRGRRRMIHFPIYPMLGYPGRLD